MNLVQLLAESGADTRTLSKDGKTAICLAAAAGHMAVLSYLMDKDHDTPTLMDDHKVCTLLRYR